MEKGEKEKKERGRERGRGEGGGQKLKSHVHISKAVGLFFKVRPDEAENSPRFLLVIRENRK